MGELIRVLVVDDSNLFREALANFVADLDDITVVGRARDGREALDMVPFLRPHVVLMDVMMPRLDGIEATRVLKRAPDAPAVVVCTTEDDHRLRLAALAAGADSFLLKRELGVKVETLIRALARPFLQPARRVRNGGLGGSP
jgi:DNA-binding NarL/FixJ family response regulator